MKIETIEIRNFGKLQNFSVRLNDGFNLLYGQNEAGKSTLMAFLKMMFYGSSGRGTDPAKNPRKKYAPWNGQRMAGAVEFRDDGIRYRIEKVFGASQKTDRIRLLNLATGNPVQIAGEEEIGRKFFGMGVSAFEKSVFIGQIGSIINSSGDKEDEITQKLLNLVSVGDESTSMKKVRDRLQTAKEAIRSKSGRIGTAVRLEQQLSSLQDERGEALNRENEKNQLSQQAANLSQQTKELEDASWKNQARYNQQQKLAVMEKLKTLLDEIRIRELEIGSLRSGSLGVDEDFLKSCQNRMNTIRTQEALLADKTKDRKQLDKEFAEIESAPVNEIPDGYAEQIRDKEKEQKRLEELQGVLEDILHAKNELNQLLEQKQKSAGAPRHLSENPGPLHTGLPLLISSLAVLLLSVICGIFVHPFCFAGIVAAVLLGIFSWKKNGKAARGRAYAGQKLNQYGDFFDQRISETKKKLEEKEEELEAQGMDFSGLQDSSQLRNQLKETADAQDNLHKTVTRLLSQKGCKTSDELRDRQIKWQNHLTRLNAKDSDRKRAREEEIMAENGLRQEEDKLLQAIRPFAHAETPEEAGRAIIQWEKKLNKIRILDAEIDSRREGLPAKMQEKPAEELRQYADALHDELFKECGGTLPEKCDESKMLEFKQQSDDNQARSQDCEKKLIEINGDIRNRFSGKRGVGEIDNEISRVRLELKRQTDYYECLDIAQQILEAAFQEISQNFGPALNEKAANILSGLTGGKYQHVTISRNFDLQVQQADDPVSHEWQYLSNGTIDQAYFALRMAVSELLCRDGKRLPLLLDDVFLQYDDQRAERGLRFLVDYANDNENPTQIVFFTCHQHLIEQLHQVNSQIPVLSLRQ